MSQRNVTNNKEKSCHKKCPKSVPKKSSEKRCPKRCHRRKCPKKSQLARYSQKGVQTNHGAAIVISAVVPPSQMVY